MTDPLTLFRDDYHAARAAGVDLAEAIVLATRDADGAPAARTVLFKGVESDPPAVTFFTNYTSAKADDLTHDPRAALCVYWHPVRKQYRLSGRVEKTTPAESDAYFASRPRGSQVGAWASDQSTPLASYDGLLARVREVEARYEGRVVPRPPHWGGYRLHVTRAEVWTEVEFRLHRRDVYMRRENGDGWAHSLLNP